MPSLPSYDPLHVSNNVGVSVDICECCFGPRVFFTTVQCESTNPPPRFFLTFPPNGWELLVQILHAYCVFLSTLDYKFLFNYL